MADKLVPGSLADLYIDNDLVTLAHGYQVSPFDAISIDKEYSVVLADARKADIKRKYVVYSYIHENKQMYDVKYTDSYNEAVVLFAARLQSEFTGAYYSIK